MNVSQPNSPSVSFTIPSDMVTLFACSNQTSDQHIQDRFSDYSSFYRGEECGIPPRTMYYSYPTTVVPSAQQTSNIVPTNCSVIELPRNSSEGNPSDPFDLITAEYTLELNVSEACYKCFHGGGQCGHNSRNEFHCQKAQSKCQKSYSCGNFSLEFPFTDIKDPDCGLWMVDGCDSTYENPRLYLGATTMPRYSILGKTSINKFLIHDMKLHSNCPTSLSSHASIKLPTNISKTISKPIVGKILKPPHCTIKSRQLTMLRLPLKNVHLLNYL
ncbi:hypothetical protein C2S53_015418 [Perilla frutescens var. hirtella]|uniref:Uncharacterized protein n=1 Tax=Perilla frutescens var. hirtella TaxID=608512 RepID=A0AAD4J5V8_PERFH|nr:hypothetical protein C2S53_015418 [Perilla frutescens var. hirtella]